MAYEKKWVFKNTTHWSILQDNFVVGIGSGTTIVYAVERLGQLLCCISPLINLQAFASHMHTCKCDFMQK